MSKNHDRHPKTRYGGPDRNLKRKSYEKELEKLQVELVKLQEWIKYKGLKVVAIFEGRDAAGKGGVIKRITEPQILEYAAWWPWLRQLSARSHNGTFNVTCRIYPRLVKWCCLTEAGTTGPGLSV